MPDVAEHCGKPKEHFGAFDSVRTFFCIGVMIFHTFAWPTTLGIDGPFDERWIPTVLGDWFLPCCMAGINAVDVFFMISGFFMTKGLLDRLEAGTPLFEVFSKAVANRWLRLAPVCIVVCILGMARKDMGQYGEYNDVSWSRLAQFILLRQNYNSPSAMWWDLSTVPLWSVGVDWQASVFLCIVVPLLYKKFGMSVKPMYGLLAFFMILRVAWYIPNAVCMNLTLSIVTLNWFPWDLCLFTTDRFVQQCNELKADPDNMKMIPLDLGFYNPLGCDYHPNYRHHWHWWFNTWYCPTHMRIVPFIIGAIMAYHYLQAKAGTSKPWPSIVGRVLVAASFFHIGMTFQPPSMGPSDPEILIPMLHWGEVTGKLFYPGAMAVILYSAIVPEDYPFHCKCAKTFLGCCGVCKIFGTLSFCIYCTHWWVCNLFIEWWKPEFTFGGCIASLGLTLAITLPLSFLMKKLVEDPVERLRRSAISR